MGLTPEEIAALRADFRLQEERSLREREAEAAKVRESTPPPAPPKPLRKRSKPRVGPRMRAIQAFASAYPGESATTVVVATTGPYKRWSGHPSHRKALYRAEAAGLVIIDYVQPNFYRVFANEGDRQQFYADHEAGELGQVRALADVVSALPGCTKTTALRAADVTVRVLNKAIDIRLVLVEYERANRCRLFATERDKKIWHLQRELLQPGTPAEQVAEIRAAIDHLQAKRTMTWAQ
jgi:hypothetical protein